MTLSGGRSGLTTEHQAENVAPASSMACTSDAAPNPTEGQSAWVARWARTASTRRLLSSVSTRFSLSSRCLTCASIVRPLRCIRLATPALVSPSAISCSTSRSRSVSSASPGDRRPAYHAADDVRMFRGGQELFDIEPPVLEQVAEGAPFDQVHGVPGLDVLGQQTYSDRRVEAPERIGDIRGDQGRPSRRTAGCGETDSSCGQL